MWFIMKLYIEVFFLLMLEDKASFILISREISPTAFLKLWTLHKCKIVQVWPFRRIEIWMLLPSSLSAPSPLERCFSSRAEFGGMHKGFGVRRRYIQITTLPPTTDELLKLSDPQLLVKVMILSLPTSRDHFLAAEVSPETTHSSPSHPRTQCQ